MKKAFTLRDIGVQDLERVLEWRNSDHVRLNMFNNDIIKPEEHYAWFEKIKNDSQTSVKIFEVNGQSAGVMQFSEIDRKNKRCSWGFYLRDINAGQGLGMKMGYLGLKYAFEELKVRKVCGQVFQFNSNSINFHQRLGFVIEGIFKQHVLNNGKYEDVVYLAMFKNTWDSEKQRLEKQIFNQN